MGNRNTLDPDQFVSILSVSECCFKIVDSSDCKAFKSDCNSCKSLSVTAAGCQVCAGTTELFKLPQPLSVVLALSSASIQMTARKGKLAAMKTVGPQHELFIITENATVIRVKTDEISRTGRATQGVKMMSVADGDRVTAVARMTSAKKKPKAPAVMEGQEALDLGAATDAGADTDDHVDIGSGDAALEDLLEE